MGTGGPSAPSTPTLCMGFSPTPYIFIALPCVNMHLFFTFFLSISLHFYLFADFHLPSLAFGDSCGNRRTLRVLLARLPKDSAFRYQAHRFQLKTRRRRIFFTLKPSRARFLLFISSSTELLSAYSFVVFGDSCGNRTRVAGVRGRSLNRLTNEPCLSSQRLMVFALISPCNFSWCTIRGSNPGHPD